MDFIIVEAILKPQRSGRPCEKKSARMPLVSHNEQSMRNLDRITIDWSVMSRCLRTPWLLLLALLVLPPVVCGQKSEPSIPVEQALHHGLALDQAGHFDEALQIFEDALHADPKNPTLLNAIGATYSLKGDSAQAQSFFLRCLAVNARFNPARKNLAISYFRSGDYDSSADQFNRLLAAQGESRKTAELFLGMIHEKKKEYAESVSAFESAGELIYQYPEAMLSLAESYSKLQRPHKADAILARLNGLKGVTDVEFFQAGLIYAEHGQNDRALDEFERVRQTSENYPGLMYQRALAMDQLGHWKEALKVLEDATKENPDADSLNLLARVAEENHETVLAFQSLRQAAKLAPEKEDNYLDFSTLCLDHGNNQLALEAVDIGLANVPASYRLLVQKGAVFEKLSRYHEAEDILRKANALQPEESAALLSLGIVQAHEGKLEEAIATLEAAVSRFPHDSYLHYYLGKTLVRLAVHKGTPDKENPRAEAEFKASVRLNPSFADSYYQLARLYLRTQPARAEQDLIACLKKDPNHASAEYTLGRIYVKTGRTREGRELLARFERDKKISKQQEENNPGVEAVPE